MADLNNNIINTNIAGNTSNILIPDLAAIASGIVFKSNVNSNVLNGFYNSLSESVQYLQFTGGLYDDNADYTEGNIASLVIKNGTDYSIWQFRRNSNNPRVLNNNPPISGASINRVNGVDAYEGGTLNTDWDKLTEDYAIEATANTVMGRDSEGASNVNMPSSITNTSIVNNEYLQQELQSGLATKQDKLTAGTNVEITEDNVINIKGDVATDAESVTYDNTNTNLEYISGYDFPKFKVEIPDTIDFIAGERQTISIKKSGDNYFMSFKMMLLFQASISFYLMQLETNLYKTYSTINQFFQTVSESEENYYDALEGEIVWEEITNLEELKDNPNVILPDGSFNFDLIKTKPLQVQSKFKITNGINSSNFLIIKNEALEEIPPETYCVLTLNIKNRVLRNEDTNIFTSSFAFMTAQSIMDFYSFTLEQDNNNVKLKGSYTLKEGAGNSIGFYSPIIENYFNVSSTEAELINTNGITSSSGKPLKYSFTKNTKTGSGDPPYILFLGYQDGSTLEAGDTITFNLTPDKNSALDPVYSEVTNVQQMGEVLASRYLLPCYYEQLTDDNGNFLEEEEPANWYKRLYNLDTVWELIHNTKSIVYRTEGTKSSVDRVNGLQPYGVEQLIGNFYSGFSDDGPVGMFSSGNGVFTASFPHPTTPLYQGGERTAYRAITFDSAKIIKSYTNDLVMDNLPVRKWKLKSINGVLVKYLLRK